MLYELSDGLLSNLKKKVFGFFTPRIKKKNQPDKKAKEKKSTYSI